MKPITLKLTVEELSLLTSLAADQLFRREFIDPRMPGYRAVPGQVALGKSLIAGLRQVLDESARQATGARTGETSYAWASPSKRPTRVTNAV
jgi:hypothetical protein